MTSLRTLGDASAGKFFRLGGQLYMLNSDGEPVLLTPEQDTMGGWPATAMGGSGETAARDLERMLRNPEALAHILCKPTVTIPGQPPRALINDAKRAGKAAAVICSSINKIRAPSSGHILTLDDAASDGAENSPALRAALSDLIDLFFPAPGFFGTYKAVYNHTTFVEKLVEYGLAAKKEDGHVHVMKHFDKHHASTESRINKLEATMEGTLMEVGTIRREVKDGFKSVASEMKSISDTNAAALTMLADKLNSIGGPPAKARRKAITRATVESDDDDADSPKGASSKSSLEKKKGICYIKGCKKKCKKRDDGKHYTVCSDHKGKHAKKCDSCGKKRRFLHPDGTYPGKCDDCDDDDSDDDDSDDDDDGLDSSLLSFFRKKKSDLENCRKLIKINVVEEQQWKKYAAAIGIDLD